MAVDPISSDVADRFLISCNDERSGNAICDFLFFHPLFSVLFFTQPGFRNVRPIPLFRFLLFFLVTPVIDAIHLGCCCFFKFHFFANDIYQHRLHPFSLVFYFVSITLCTCLLCSSPYHAAASSANCFSGQFTRKIPAKIKLPPISKGNPSCSPRTNQPNRMPNKGAKNRNALTFPESPFCSR